MLDKLDLTNFKSFRKASLSLGPLTVLVGANASGKSNIRDAFRFLHGISRGYALSEVIGQKSGEGGERQWLGIRGGTRELAHYGSDECSVAVELGHAAFGGDLGAQRYEICILPGNGKKPASVVRERLSVAGEPVFESEHSHGDVVRVSIARGGKYRKGHVEEFSSHRPVLTQIAERVLSRRSDASGREVAEAARGATKALLSIRFMDLDPEAMREPSLPGQDTLGDRGENLSSVLQTICDDKSLKQSLLLWLQELTPMDVRDLEFPADQIGRVLVSLVEQDGHATSAYSASDGTLRFLATIAALLGPQRAGLYFVEELETGLHPTRLHLLLDMIEREVTGGKIQMIATTHSPVMLAQLSHESLQHAAVTYRLDEHSDTQVARIADIPQAMQVIEDQDLARLHSSGWLEDILHFAEEPGEASP